ncbi:MAG TPA: hypothetical protein EYQ54_09385 [Myxococcales bacterium]|nr:hypothetical protein [Myxococcales bacterium]
MRSLGEKSLSRHWRDNLASLTGSQATPAMAIFASHQRPRNRDIPKTRANDRFARWQLSLSVDISPYRDVVDFVRLIDPGVSFDIGGRKTRESNNHGSNCA